MASVAGLESAKPEEVGISSERLQRFKEHFEAATDGTGRFKGLPRIPGAVLAVMRKGKLCHLSASGKRDIEKGLPMEPDTIFRIYSLTKLVTSVAVLQLYERGFFQLDDPLHEILPQFKDMYANETPNGVIQPYRAKTPISIRHLLTHTSGFSYGSFDPSPVGQYYKESGIDESPSSADTLEQFADKMSNVVLKFEPGSGFNYGVSTDILGRVVEVLSGKSLADYFSENILGPLGMVDTGFFVEPSKADRVCTMYEMGPDNKLQPSAPVFGADTPTQQRPFQSGGAGLFSTVPDQLKLFAMLANKGELGGARILGTATVEFMTRNHLPGGKDAAQMHGQMADFAHMRGLGWGLGVAVVLSPEFGDFCSDGTYFWQGVGSTFYFHDPKKELTGVAFSQFMPCVSPLVRGLRADLRSLVQQALVE